MIFELGHKEKFSLFPAEKDGVCSGNRDQSESGGKKECWLYSKNTVQGISRVYSLYVGNGGKWDGKKVENQF